MNTTFAIFKSNPVTIPAHNFPANSFRSAALIKLSADCHAGTFDPRTITKKSDCDALQAKLNQELPRLFNWLGSGHQLSRKYLRDVLTLMRDNIEIYKTPPTAIQQSGMAQKQSAAA